MKKAIITLLLAGGGCATAEAQSAIKVRLTDERPINVAVDGRYFNKRGTSVTVGDIPAGYHSIRIFASRYTRWGGTSEEKIYEGRVTTHNGSITTFTLDARSGEVYLQDRDMDNMRPMPPAGQPLANGYSGTYNERGDNNNNNQGQYNNNTYNTLPPADNNTAAPDNVNDNQPPSSPVASPVSDDEIGTLTDSKLDKMKTKTAAKKTDTEKLKLVQDDLKKEKVSTNEIGVMMDWFSFESTKTEFAKWAYSIAVDKERYSELVGKLTYKQYQDELQQFITTLRK